jgi:hypothetical protein
VPISDTSRNAAAAQLRALRRLSPERRLELAVEMSLAARALLSARIWSEHPDWREEQVNARVLRLILPGISLPPAAG